jgi:hypothetical protein
MPIVVSHPSAHRGVRHRMPARGQPAPDPEHHTRITVPLGSAAALGCGFTHPVIPQACGSELLTAAEAAVDGALRATFVPDPLLGPGLSQLGSVLASVVKRHGGLIEMSITDVLERSGRYIVLRGVAMPITVPTQELVRASTLAQLGDMSIALSGPVAQTVFLDLIVIDRHERRAIIAEVKRGSGKNEARKIHQVAWVLRCAQVQGRAFLASLGFEVASARAVLIDVYGRAGYDDDLTVTGAAIDRLFAVPVTAAVEAVTAVLRGRLRAAVPDLLTVALASLGIGEGAALPRRSELPSL